ncbi:acyl-CoA dehydrogenase family protein [Mycolicibacterium sp.]|uniref:acyl-CoA dehydrogenase family protein n=1 Tax=Mycolicibacterium sp. TaxID=2320850 RepID=UPI001A2221FE|nr:acyl-CoA dehydrogenase family protein [Mycolicibacterium sp.]MBJ7336383.1 acyl-CoA dehydrogenase family protein [Mycolicibacterium sp.]
MNSPTTQVAFDELLTADTLSALMRSTWTWDDRALRRDLAILLVELGAVRAAPPDRNAARIDTLRARAHSSAARFVATVLGPKLVADTGNPLRSGFLADAVDPARFDRTAASSFADVRATASEYVTEHTREVDYPAETEWLGLVATDGADGLGRAMRGYGHSLSDSPFFGNIGLAWQTLRAVIGESTVAGEYAEALVSGRLSATLAAAEQTGSWDPAMVKTRAAETAEGWQLTGVKQFVPATEDADVYLVIARSTAGPSLFATEGSAPGLTVTPLDVIDPTRPLAQIELSGTPATLLGTEGAGGRLMLRAIDLATTALAAEQVGLIERAMTLLSQQSADLPDAPASEFRVAGVTLDHMAAAALWRRALAEDAAGSAHASAAAAAAHVGCSAAALRAATAAAELLGPSDETDAILRRALSGSLLFGGPALSHERLLERLGI